MKTWQQFLENNVEKEEEKSGIDVDHDHEVGEPAAHQKKVKQAHADMIDFFQQRKAGAAKIAAEAKAKGGPAMLTFWHFAAKAKPYAEVLRAIKDGKDKKFFITECKELLSQIQCGGMSQKNFQQIMGRLEVFGEAVAQLF